tara:strand:- start:1518 stop:1946 length:429 start_codon:yes stop_codon:yes gene_type:complete
MGYNVAHYFMINFNFLKNIVLIILVLMSIFFVYLLFVSYKNTPVVQDIGNITIDDFISEQPLISDENYVADEEVNLNFNYKLIGIRSGGENSSVIVKKANKEYLVAMGQLLDNTFELVEVNQNSAIFRNGVKMYRINKDEEK